MVETYYVHTPLGIAQLEGDQVGLSKVCIGDDLEKIPENLSADIPDCLQTAVRQLNEYFNGSRKCFDLALNPAGTDFQKKVWHALQTIPFGKTISYLELSKILGNPKAVRAVAAANGQNPLWIIIPCHRVIGSDGALTGYAGGLHRKKWLLAHELGAKQLALF